MQKNNGEFSDLHENDRREDENRCQNNGKNPRIIVEVESIHLKLRMDVEHVEALSVCPLFLGHVENFVERVEIGLERVMHVGPFVEPSPSEEFGVGAVDHIGEHVRALRVQRSNKRSVSFRESIGEETAPAEMGMNQRNDPRFSEEVTLDRVD